MGPTNVELQISGLMRLSRTCSHGRVSWQELRSKEKLGPGCRLRWVAVDSSSAFVRNWNHHKPGREPRREGTRGRIRDKVATPRSNELSGGRSGQVLKDRWRGLWFRRVRRMSRMFVHDGPLRERERGREGGGKKLKGWKERRAWKLIKREGDSAHFSTRLDRDVCISLVGSARPRCSAWESETLSIQPWSFLPG